MNSINNWFLINGERVPLIFVGKKDDGRCMNLFLDETSPDLIQQVENCAKAIKRADYNQIVLAKETIDDPNLILNIINWFLEEDVQVISIFNDNISQDSLEKLEEVLEYGIINPLIMPNEIQKKLCYRKK